MSMRSREMGDCSALFRRFFNYFGRRGACPSFGEVEVPSNVTVFVGDRWVKVGLSRECCEGKLGIMLVSEAKAHVF